MPIDPHSKEGFAGGRWGRAANRISPASSFLLAAGDWHPPPPGALVKKGPVGHQNIGCPRDGGRGPVGPVFPRGPRSTARPFAVGLTIPVGPMVIRSYVADNLARSPGDSATSPPPPPPPPRGFILPPPSPGCGGRDEALCRSRAPGPGPPRGARPLPSRPTGQHRNRGLTNRAQRGAWRQMRTERQEW